MMLDIAAIFEVEAKGPSRGAPSDWALDLRLLPALATFTCLRFWTSEVNFEREAIHFGLPYNCPH